jgi:hypothetical protein
LLQNTDLGQPENQTSGSNSSEEKIREFEVKVEKI